VESLSSAVVVTGVLDHVTVGPKTASVGWWEGCLSGECVQHPFERVHATLYLRLDTSQQTHILLASGTSLDAPDQGFAVNKVVTRAAAGGTQITPAIKPSESLCALVDSAANCKTLAAINFGSSNISLEINTGGGVDHFYFSNVAVQTRLNSSSGADFFRSFEPSASVDLVWVLTLPTFRAPLSRAQGTWTLEMTNM
jgi:hypothetical protein